jgi:CheY-like chemotaxis protein
MSIDILLVEDEDGVRESMKQVLELEGYRVETAADGDEALGQMRSLEHVEVILLDLMLPGMSGRQIRDRQLEEGLLVDTPVIVLSGANDALEAGPEKLKAVEWLAKPVRPGDLCATLETYLQS